ncbi:hypothetical protein EV426DRAFT_679684 [Tirmania nivea]|nr:hypothetical protein EV426DRAFT_679684 [Tirmania nivea]
MATGMEIAGLVLGAFPLAIEGIKAYSNGMKTIKDMKNYQQILRQFTRELKVERCKYDNTLLEVLTMLVGPANASQMKADLTSAEWDDEGFQAQLKTRLRPAEGTLDNWLGVAKQLNKTLCEVCEKFRLPPEKKSTLLGRSRKFDPRSAWDVGMLGKYRTAEQMQQIRQWNEDLDTLANGGRKSTPAPGSVSHNSPTISRSLITYHRRVQGHARKLYSMLREKLEPPTCKCDVPHSTYLELEMRGMPPTKALSNSQADLGPNQFFTFSLMFSTAPKNGHDQLMAMWKELQLEPIDDRRCIQNVPSPTSERGRSVTSTQCLNPSPMITGQPPHTRRTAWGTIFSRTPSSSPGLPAAQKPHPSKNRPTMTTPINRPPTKMKITRFADGDTSSGDDDVNIPHAFSYLPTISCFCTTLALYTTTHHQKSSPKRVGLLICTKKHEHRVWTQLQHFPKPARLVSLAELITTHANVLDKPSCESRLVLGLKLISSVLQLDSTQWLPEKWEAKDILFPGASLQVADQHHRRNILLHPFAHRNFSSVTTTSACDDYADSNQRSANQAKATFSSLYNSSSCGQSELLFSYQLSEKLFEEAGNEYAMAVRRCIRGFEMRETDLEDDSFRSKVYHDVFGLLEDNLRIFSRCDNIHKIVGEE